MLAGLDALEIEMGMKRLDQVNSFVYLGCRVIDADCTNEAKCYPSFQNQSRNAIMVKWPKTMVTLKNVEM